MAVFIIDECCVAFFKLLKNCSLIVFADESGLAATLSWGVDVESRLIMMELELPDDVTESFCDEFETLKI